MQIEHIARIGLAAGRAAQQQRYLAVGPSLLGEVVVHHQRVLAPVAEVLAHGAARVGRDVLHGGGIGGRRRNHDGVLHGAEFLELAHHVGHRGVLLADGHVDALDPGAALIDDGIHGHRGLAGLPVADNQFALAAADGNHRIDRFQTGLDRLSDRLAGNHAGGHLLDGRELARFNRPLAVHRVAQGIHNAAQQRLAHRHFQNAPGGLHHIAFGDMAVVAQDHRAHRILLQVQRKAVRVARKLQHFAVLSPGQAVNAADAVGDGHHRAHLNLLRGGIEILDALADQITNFVRFQSHSTIRY